MQQDSCFRQRYAAIQARDARFDGMFYTGVRSTGIYCRPSCPARTPKPENVTFFRTAAAAQEAGFRACKRCAPNALPGSPGFGTAARALRLITEGVVDSEGVSGLAARLGYSSRQLHRILVSEYGAGALALARAHRAEVARTLITSTDLPLSDVAFASGFGSVRQFNDTMRITFGSCPSDMKRGASSALNIELAVRQPFDAVGLLEFLAARAIPGVEVVDVFGRRYARTVTLPGGPGAIEISITEDGRILAGLELANLSDASAAIACIRRMFDLDADPMAVDKHLGELASVPGIRVPGAASAHEMLMRALVGQQISVAAARKHLSRLAMVAGTKYSSRFEGLSHCFPTPAQIITAIPDPESLHPDRALRLPRQSVRAVIAAMQAFEHGELCIDSDDLFEQLIALPRVGTWTARYFMMRTLNDPDTWPEGDVALLAGARNLGFTHENHHKQLAQIAEQWAPWRSYAAMHIWRHA